VTGLPIWIKANAGLPEIVDGNTVYRQLPDVFAEKARELVEIGANFIGGCCGTSPDFIRALARLFTETQSSSDTTPPAERRFRQRGGPGRR
jgi:5-methyltetrahydrofolate--homocysteine methyltransferase